MRAATVRLAAATAIAVALAAGCTQRYVGPARPFDPAELTGDGWVRVAGVPELRQERADDCGAAAVAMVLGYWRLQPRLDDLEIPEGGLHARDLRAVLRDHGLRAFVIEGTFADLEHELGSGRPVIVGTLKPVDRRKALAHYEVVVAYHPVERRVVTLDPAAGWRVSPLDGFLAEWGGSEWTTIVALPR